MSDQLEFSPEQTSTHSSTEYDKHGFFITKSDSQLELDEPPINVIRSREIKWRAMCIHWHYWSKRNRSKVRERCIKGIPDSMRLEAWQRLTGSVMTPRASFSHLDKGKLTSSSDYQSLPDVKRRSKFKLSFRGSKRFTKSNGTSPMLPARNSSASVNLQTYHDHPLIETIPSNSPAFGEHLQLRHMSSDSSQASELPSIEELDPNTANIPSEAIFAHSVHRFKASNYIQRRTDFPANATGSAGYSSMSTASSSTASNSGHPNEDLYSVDNQSLASSESIISYSTSFDAKSLMHHQSSISNITADDARATLVPTDVDPTQLYESYCAEIGDPDQCEQIRKDITRQFPYHEVFQNDSHGQESLYNILKAYTIRHPEKGYCQAQAPIAAVLLMYMPEVNVFWTFEEICTRYLEAYFDEVLERIRIDGEILFAFLRSRYYQLHKYFRKHEVQPELIVPQWFMCVFTRTLPWPAVLRVLDMFFFEGKVVLFRVAMVLLRRMFGNSALRKECDSIEGILLRINTAGNYVKKLEAFIREVATEPVSPRDVANEAKRQSLRWAAAAKKGQ